MKFKFTQIVLLFALIASIGCGGGSASSPGGGGGGGGGGGAPATASVFVSDDLSTTYDHIWVSIKKVEAEDAIGTKTVLYNSPTGTVMDLRQLGDNTGPLFSLLGTSSVPATPFTKVNVTLDAKVTLVAKGASTGTVQSFLNLDSGGNKVFSFNFASPRTLGGQPLVVDFDLKDWVSDGNNVTGSSKDGDKTGLDDPARHCRQEYRGLVSGLTGTAPVQSFKLTTEQGASFTVQTSATTTLTNNDGSPNPALADAEKVSVYGYYDQALQSFQADSVRIQVATEVKVQSARGTSSVISPTAYTFDLTIQNLYGFLPKGALIHIATTADTKYCSDGGRQLGADDFFGALPNADWVEVVGTYDDASQTLTATVVRAGLKDQALRAEVHGSHVADIASPTFSIHVDEVEGINLPEKDHPKITVDTSTAEHFFDENSVEIDSPTFFTKLATATEVEADGPFNFDTKTLSAKRLKIQRIGQEQHRKVFVGGPNLPGFDANAGTFSVAAFKWEDINLNGGAKVNFTTDANTKYFNVEQAPIDQATFFAALNVQTRRVGVLGQVTFDPANVPPNPTVAALEIHLLPLQK